VAAAAAAAAVPAAAMFDSNVPNMPSVCGCDVDVTCTHIYSRAAYTFTEPVAVTACCTSKPPRHYFV
jgi:hypothetical protein